MVKRIKLGILYDYNENWIGGTYFILNVIKLLNKLSIFKKPEIFIFYNDIFSLDHIKVLKYPHIRYISINEVTYVNKPKLDLNLFKRILNFITRRIFNRNLFNHKDVIPEIDVFFPSDFNSIFSKSKNQLFWIPDFQDRHFKNFFSFEEILIRKEWQEKISKQDHILFSSEDALKDFNFFFPESISKCHIFNFVSILDEFKVIDFESLSKKYNLNVNKRYFFVSNQFWIHKNHKIIFEAMNLLRNKKELKFDVYFSGKQNDYRNTGYFNELLKIINKYNLSDNVKMLGFIDRSDQLSLMKYSMAIIQPSLFEGWSTVIEDAKALNKIIICSKINVHKEQLGNNGIFFDPNNLVELSEKMLYVSCNKIYKNYNYNKNIRLASNNFYKILKSIISKI